MPTCSANTIAIPRPTLDSQQNCNQLDILGGLGPMDPLDKARLTRRPNRPKVKAQLHDFICLSLGAPIIKLELDEQQIDLAIEYTMKIFENYAGREYFEYYTFNTTPGKSVYEMPPDVGYIRNVFYKKHPTLTFQSTDLQGAIPIEYFSPGGGFGSLQGGLIDPIQPIWGQMGPWTLYKQYEQMYSNVSSATGGWEWIGDQGHVKLYPIPFRSQAVIVHYIQKNKDWKEITQCLCEGSLSWTKLILGNIWGKFLQLPGPGGGVQLNWQKMAEEGKEEWKQWKEDLLTKFGDTGPGITLG